MYSGSHLHRLWLVPWAVLACAAGILLLAGAVLGRLAIRAGDAAIQKER